MKKTILILLPFLILPFILRADGFKMVKIDSTYMIDELFNSPETSFLSMNAIGDVVFNLRGDIAMLKDGKLSLDKRLPMFADSVLPNGICANYKNIKHINNEGDLYVLISRYTNSLYKRENNEWKLVVKSISNLWQTNPVSSYDIDKNGVYWFVSMGVPYFHRFDGNKVSKVYGKDTIDPNDFTFYPGSTSYGCLCIGTDLYYIGGTVNLIKFNTITGEREVFIPKSVFQTDKIQPLMTKKIKRKNGKYWFATSRPSIIGFDENGYEIVDLSGGKLTNKIGDIRSVLDFAIADDGSYWLSTLEDSSRLYHIFSKDSFRIHNEIRSQQRNPDPNYQDLELALGIEIAPDGTVYIITRNGALLYYGENPLYVKEDTENDNNFGLYKIYPNPAKEQINVEILCNSTFNPISIELDLYDYSGQKIKKINSYSFERNKSNGTATFKFDKPDIPKGFYFLSINVDGRVQAKSIIIDN